MTRSIRKVSLVLSTGSIGSSRIIERAVRTVPLLEVLYSRYPCQNDLDKLRSLKHASSGRKLVAQKILDFPNFLSWKLENITYKRSIESDPHRFE